MAFLVLDHSTPEFGQRAAQLFGVCLRGSLLTLNLNSAPPSVSREGQDVRPFPRSVAQRRLVPPCCDRMPRVGCRGDFRSRSVRFVSPGGDHLVHVALKSHQLMD